ncbi:MAG: hypothetical protein K9L62_06355 [Vallitaleaceae bacterium]|nr:hypothetical protein [Vallitaleaceae bacterium]
MDSIRVNKNLEIALTDERRLINIDAIKEDMVYDLQKVFERYKLNIVDSNLKFISTWLLENDLYLKTVKNTIPSNNETLSRGRAINVNAGVSGIGREQKYPHVYIVLGEHQDTFIGVPITNMAFDRKTNRYYLRHFYEVELKSPDNKKPYSEFRCMKPSVADIRNISGLDKRRIIKNKLYDDKKFVSSNYLNAVNDKIRTGLTGLI